MSRWMTVFVGAGLVAACVLGGLSLEQSAAATREDMALLDRQRATRTQRHQERVARLEQQRDALPAEYVRQETFAQAASDTNRHLRVDLDASVIMLVEDGYVIRRSAVQVGDPLAADGEREAVDITRGRRVIDQRIREGQFELPDWAGWQGERPKKQRKRSRRKRRRPLPKPIDGLYGARTLILDDGSVMYSTPGWGPWASDNDVRPGGIEMSFTDMASLFGAISTGASVYVY